MFFESICSLWAYMVLDIRSARQVSRMRQRDLAAAAGISVHELMKLERGLIIPSEKLLLQISNCLGVDVNQIAVAQNSAITYRRRLG